MEKGDCFCELNCSLNLNGFFSSYSYLHSHHKANAKIFLVQILLVFLLRVYYQDMLLLCGFNSDYCGLRV